MSASRAALLAGMLAALASFSCGSDRDDGAARLVCIQFRPGFFDDDRRNPFTPFVIRQTDHGRVVDIGVTSDDLFDFAGINIFPAGDDHVVLPVDNFKKAVRVLAGHIAG